MQKCRVTVLSQKENGGAEIVEVDLGDTVREAFKAAFPDDSPREYRLKLNRQATGLDAEVEDGDVLSVAPMSVAGA